MKKYKIGKGEVVKILVNISKGNDEDWKFILWEMKNLLSCMQNLIELMSQDI